MAPSLIFTSIRLARSAMVALLQPASNHEWTSSATFGPSWWLPTVQVLVQASSSRNARGLSLFATSDLLPEPTRHGAELFEAVAVVELLLIRDHPDAVLTAPLADHVTMPAGIRWPPPGVSQTRHISPTPSKATSGRCPCNSQWTTVKRRTVKAPGISQRP